MCRVASASGTEIEDAALSGKRLPRQLPVWVAWKRVAASAPTIVFLADAAATMLPSAASREAPTATRTDGRRDRIGPCQQVGEDVACEYPQSSTSENEAIEVGVQDEVFALIGSIGPRAVTLAALLDDSPERVELAADT